jgi:two-component system, NtrC family, response regulator AlgB
VRIVAATNRDLEADVAAGRFREDLRFRLNVIEVVVPPLRERREDIARLAARFLEFFASRAGRPRPELDATAMAALGAYAWPGNVRELRNAMERAVILSPARMIGREALPRAIAEAIAGAGDGGVHIGGDHALEAVEWEHIRRVLARVGSMEDAARVLGIDSSTLWRKRKKHEE